MANHILKTDPDVFQASFEGLKNFEIRFNDRDYKAGDYVDLRETQYSGEEMANGKPLEYTGRAIEAEIKYVLTGGKYGLSEGWVILAL
jgi:hypothetical protein